MSAFSKTINTFFLSVIIMALIITVILGFMLGPLNPLPWGIIFCLIIIPYFHNKITIKNKIVWDSSMSTGIKFIDQDHKKLISLINKFQQATEYQMSDSEIIAAMNKVVDYTKYHFSREEELMQLNNYPGFEDHQKQHQKMIKTIGQCVNECEKGQKPAVDHILSFLQYWLVNHINHTDKDYVPYLKITSLPNKTLPFSQGDKHV